MTSDIEYKHFSQINVLNPIIIVDARPKRVARNTRWKLPALNCSNHLLFCSFSNDTIAIIERGPVSTTSLSRFLPPYLLKGDGIKTGRLSPVLLFFPQIFLTNIPDKEAPVLRPPLFLLLPEMKSVFRNPGKSCSRTTRIHHITRHLGALGKPRMELAMDREVAGRRYSSRIKLGRYGCAIIV